ncbi:MAG: hypothetical protein R6U17_05630 [Thermoplasmata archaeon]
MNEKKSARLKALVVAFILVFAGFAALMTIPGPTSAQGSDIETISQTVSTSESAELDLLEDELPPGDWYYRYDAPHRPDDDDALGLEEPAIWWFAMTLDPFDFPGQIQKVAVYDRVAVPMTARIREGGVSGTEIGNISFEPAEEAQGWVELEFEEAIEIDENTVYAMVVEIEQQEPSQYCAPMVNGYVEHGGYLSFDDKNWSTLQDFGFDFTFMMEACILQYVPSITTTTVSDPTPDSVQLNAEHKISIMDEVEVSFEYRELGAGVWDGPVGQETYYDSGEANYTLTGLDYYQIYEYRAVLDFEFEGTEDTFYGDPVPFTLSPLTVTVLDQADDSPIEGAEITLNTLDIPWSYSNETGEDGEIYYIHTAPINLPEAEFTYSATHRDYYLQTGEFVGEEYTIYMEHRTEWTVEVGPVLYMADADTEIPIEGADLEISWKYGGETDSTVGTTDDDGYFHFNVDFSPYETDFSVTITHEDFYTKTAEFTGIISEAIYYEDIVFTIGPVLDTQGNPLENYRVRAEYEDMNFTGVAMTDEDGLAEFSVISFQPTGVEFSISITDEDDWTSDAIRLTMNRDIYVYSSYNIETVDEGQNPIEGVKIQIGDPDVRTWIYYTDSMGTVNVPKIAFPYSQVAVTISHQDYIGRAISTDGEDDISLTLLEKPEITIGPVHDIGERPLEGVPIQVERISTGANIATLTTDTNGMASFYANFQVQGDTQFGLTIDHDELVEPQEVFFEGPESGAIKLLVGEPQTVQVGPAVDISYDPVEGAMVSLSLDGDEIGTSYTDSDGIADFEVEFDPAEASFTFTVSHQDLEEDYEGQFTGSRSDAFQLDIGEEPEPPVKEYTITVGPIRDVNREAVNDATVTLSWNGEEETSTTDSSGKATFTVELEGNPDEMTFTYAVSHDDLDGDETGTFTGTLSGALQYEDIGEEEGGVLPFGGIGAVVLIIIIIIIIVVVMMKKKPAAGPEEEELFEEEEDLFEEEEEEELFEEEKEEELFEEEEEDLFEEEEEEELFEEEEEELFEEEEEF